MAKFKRKSLVVDAYQTKRAQIIHTLEGDLRAEPGDWVVTGVNGEQWPVRSDIFNKTYEPVGEDKDDIE